MGDLWAAEVPCLTGGVDFARSLSGVLERWKCAEQLEAALEAWKLLSVETEILDLIPKLRQTGVRCYLATNQEALRARHMSEVLGYGSVFDAEFYSCHMGVRKPDPDYFRSILKSIRLAGSEVLFLDDHDVNVASAREAGLHAALFSSEEGLDALRRTLGGFGLAVP